ncbi:MAG: trypsin-like serine protease [Labilithrix sp.]|nr:trypsin-like serine protease [Labilithrix sp.]
MSSPPRAVHAARSLWRAVVLAALSAASCSTAKGEEPVGRASAAILNGRPSGADEDAAVYIETLGEGNPLRCSGYLVAPGLVMTARHCLLKRRSIDVRCNADGSSANLGDDADLRTEPPEQVSVYIGAQKGTQRRVAAREIVTRREVTVCRSDVAFIVLAEPGLDVRTPLRREPVRIGDALRVSGWGYTSDARDRLPDERTTLDALAITEIGPGRIPAGTFAIGGNSLCLGDSGAAALIDGAAAGVYSRIDGEPVICSLAFTRNVFAAVAAHEELVRRAYTAIGEEPWYVGERPPWLAADGARCTRDDECRSAVCDVAAATCAPACGDAGVACPAGQRCSADACVDAEDAASTPPSDAGCALTSARPAGEPSMLLALAVAADALARRRRESARSRRQ